MNQETNSKAGIFIIAGVVAVIVTGYFVGLQAPMGREGQERAPAVATRKFGETESGLANGDGHSERPIASVEYASLANEYQGPTAQWQSDVSNLQQVAHDPMQVIVIDEADKLVSLERRATRRAFNGAPPTIPHKIEQMSAKSCLACHGEGAMTSSMRVPAMSHAFFANCTQCHVEQNSADFPAIEFRSNSFVGLPAPEAGPRAFPGAPPVIPHSTWMRESCLSCHGFTGQAGLQTTHPWRKNCEQCHAPSAVLEQAPPTANQFLPPPTILNEDSTSD